METYVYGSGSQMVRIKANTHAQGKIIFDTLTADERERLAEAQRREQDHDIASGNSWSRTGRQPSRNGGQPESLDAVYARRSAIYSGANGRPAVKGKQPERFMTVQETYDLYHARMAGDNEPWSLDKIYAFRAGIFERAGRNGGGQR